MLINLQHAIEDTQGMSFESFRKDSKTQDATVTCMEITGEAAHRIRILLSKSILIWIGMIYMLF